MKSWTNKSLLMAGCILGFAVLIYSVRPMNAGTDPVPPGMLPYTPSRLEWLELDLQANFRSEDVIDPEISYSLSFFARRPNTIVVFVQHSKRTPARMVDRAVEHGKQTVEKAAAFYGWSNWVKIEVQRELSE
jgi:hypothetical protein